MKPIFVLFFTCISLVSFSQPYKIESNKDSLMHYLNAKSNKLYPDANVEVLYEIGTTENVPLGDRTYNYEIAFKVYNAADIGDFADVVIPNVNNGIIKKITAICYNLENGKIVESKLEKENLLNDKLNNNVDVVKFSIPGIKDGSVVKYSYTCLNGYSKRKWIFQRDVPVAYSRFNYNTSTFSIITASAKTSVPFKTVENLKKLDASKLEAVSTVEKKTFNINDFENIEYRSWIRRNIAPFESEPLMEDENQLKDAVTIYFNGYSGEGFHRPLVVSWEEYNDKYWVKGNYQSVFSKNNFLNATVDNLVKSTDDTLLKIKNIFYYVQDNYTVNNNRIPIKDLLNAKQGSAGSINLLLCAMLRNAGFNSSIVLIANKYSDQLNPYLYNIEDLTNEVVSVEYKGTLFFMDASFKELPFGYLNSYLYNGYARVVNEVASSVELGTMLASNINNVNVNIEPIAEKNNEYSFSIKRSYGVYDAIAIRKLWKSDSSSFENTILDKGYDVTQKSGYHKESVVLENVNDLEKPLVLTIKGKMVIDANVNQLILDPFFVKPFTINPVNDNKDVKERKYDIYFDNVSRDNYTLNMKLNDNVTVEKTIPNTRFQFGKNGLIKYNQQVMYDQSRHSLLCKYNLENAAIMVPANEYQDLAGFYDEIIKNINQKIVIKNK